MKRFLFLNGEHTHTIDIIRILKKHKKNLIIHVLIKKKNFLCRSKYVDIYHFLPYQQTILEFVFSLEKKYAFDMIFPVGFPEVEIFAKEKEKFANIFVDDFRIVSKAIFKIETLKIAETLGIPVPKTSIINSFADIKQLEKNGFPLPLFVKSHKEMPHKIRGVAKNPQQLKNLCHKALKIGSKALIQEIIEDPFTYGVGVFAEKGKIKKLFTHKEVLHFPPTGGSGVILTTFNDKQLVSYSKKLIDFLNYTGFALLEFKYKPDVEDYVLMEINPKFWASIGFALTLKPEIFPFIPDVQLKNKLTENHICLFPDRLISTFRYAPYRTIKSFFYFLFFKGKKRVDFDFSDFKYEICKIIISLGIYLPSPIKKMIKSEK